MATVPAAGSEAAMPAGEVAIVAVAAAVVAAGGEAAAA